MQSRLFGFVVSTENEKTALGRRRGKTHSLMIFFPIGLSIFFSFRIFTLWFSYVLFWAAVDGL